MAHINWIEIVKPTNQTVTNNATPQNDSALSFAVEANSTYEVELTIKYSSAVSDNANYRWNLTYPITVATKVIGTHISLTNLKAIQQIVSLGGATKWPSADSIVGALISHTGHVFMAKLILTTGDAGTAQYKFANGTAATDSASTTMAGSILRYRKIA